METRKVLIANKLQIGGEGSHIVVQTMCNTHTNDVQATIAQCRNLYAAGAEMIRITCPGLQDVPHMKAIKEGLIAEGIEVPIVADIHFSSATAIAVAPYVDKVRINPGNFHPDHESARAEFGKFISVCKNHGTAIRIGLNHGSLGKYITDLYGNTPFAMAKAAMEWVEMCIENDFYQVVVSLKSSNTVTMVEAYRLLKQMMEERGVVFPLHVGVTEAGGGESGRIKSCVGIASLLAEGIGDTIRVSLTEDPVNEIPVARYLAKRFGRGGEPTTPAIQFRDEEETMLDASCTWGPSLLDRRIDEIPDSSNITEHLKDEIMQAARRRFYKPEYIACPGCGRTMYDLQKAYADVMKATSHLKGMVIAVMGCIVNGPGEMADADWGYVGEGNGKVSIYKGRDAVMRHVPEKEAVSELLRLIEAEQ